MCGRYLITSAPEAIRALFRYEEQPNFPPRYNIAPTQPVPIVRLVEGKRRFALVRWGLLPSWVKDPKGFSLLINARAESVLDKPAFRNAMRRRRCLFPADGFYEWKREGKAKTPMLIQLKSGEPFAFAGLYEFWKPPESDSPVKSCVIITAAPNALMEEIHDRMPAILKPQAYDLWLTPGDLPAEKTLPLLKPFAASQMKAARVSTLVNSPANDSPECIRPI